MLTQQGTNIAVTVFLNYKGQRYFNACVIKTGMLEGVAWMKGKKVIGQQYNRTLYQDISTPVFHTLNKTD
jgi:hypothetical protein